MTRSFGRVLASATMLLAGLGLAACGSDSEPADEPAATSSAYPMKLASPYGTTTLKAEPKTVAVVSDVDIDVALALGVKPVLSPLYGEISEWTAEAATAIAPGELATFDASDGIDFEAIATADPDVILATSGYSLEDDYKQLSKIAPTVSYQGKDGLTSMSWDQRLDEAAKALGLTDRAEKVKADVAAEFKAVRDANPDFEGKSYTQVNIHPEQITYESSPESDTSFFTDLGFVLPPNASKYSPDNNAVSKENIDQLDADVLFVGYPFGDEGVLTRGELESDRLFQSLEAVKGGHYGVIEDDVASPLTYKTPLSVSWVLEKLTPVLQKAVAGS